MHIIAEDAKLYFDIRKQKSKQITLRKKCLIKKD
jgi:hypothetical protein